MQDLFNFSSICQCNSSLQSSCLPMNESIRLVSLKGMVTVSLMVLIYIAQSVLTFLLFCRMILSLLSGLMFQAVGYYATLAWTSITLAFFLVN